MTDTPVTTIGLDPRRRGTHGSWLVAAAAVLATSLLVESAVAAGHGDTLHRLHEYLRASMTTHGLAFVSVLFSLWPIGKEIWHTSTPRLLNWRWLAIGPTVAALAFGEFLLGATVAFAVSLGVFCLRRHIYKNAEPGTEH